MQASEETGPLSAGYMPGLVAELVEFLRPGGRAAVLIGPDGSAKTAMIEHVLAELPGRAIRVANPLNSPLTPDRILFQIGGESDDGDDGDAIIRRLGEHRGEVEPATLAIDDAHSLDYDALQVLGRVPGAGGSGGFGMNLLIATRPESFDVVSERVLEALQDPSRALVVRLEGQGGAGPERGVGDLVASGQPASAERAGAGPPRRSAVTLSLYAGLALMALSAAALLGWPAMAPSGPPPPAIPLDSAATAAASALDDTASPSTEHRTSPPDAEDSRSKPAPSAEPNQSNIPSDGSAPAWPAPSSTAREAHLRREFGAFLSRAGRDAAMLTPAARETLFRDYLEWRDRNGFGRPRGSAP